MSDHEDIEFTVETFQRVLANDKHRLEVGAALRRWLHGQLAKGVEPDHYRMKWMHKGISLIVHELELFGRRFNSENQGDKFSTGDMVDIAESVVLTLKSYLGEPESDPDSN